MPGRWIAGYHNAMRKLLYPALAAASVVLSPSMALAANNTSGGPDIDVRLVQYPLNVSADGSLSLVWLLGIFLMIVCVAGVFKSAKRTHLD